MEAARIREKASAAAAPTENLRNEMYLVFDTLRLLTTDEARGKALHSDRGYARLEADQSLLEKGTRYIPTG